MLPNFIMIGVVRCGSTAFHEYLRQHPQVFMSAPKEPHFFSFEGESLAFRGPGDDDMINRFAITDLAKYQALFEGAGKATAIGEASAEYGYIPKALEGIKRRLPGARILCILRNPADRAFSAYGLLRSRLHEPIHDFDRALMDEERRIADGWHHIWHYRRMGFYYPQLKGYFASFAREQIRVYTYEEFRKDPLGAARDAFEFLGVDPSFVPSHGSETGPGGTPRSVLLQKALMGSGSNGLLPFIPRVFRKTIWRKLNAANLARSRISPETRAALLSEYREDIRKTQELLKRDLTFWLEAPVSADPRA